MRKWWARFSCLLLALLLAASVLPVFAAESETIMEGFQENTTDDFVILLDCSMSTSTNDTQNLCLEACWDFLDKLPIYDTRVSIFTFGYESKDGSYYDKYSSFTVESEQDKSLIHEIVSLSELTSSDDKEAYKLLVQQALEENRTNKLTWTPYSHALAAAVDMLEKNTKADASRNACVILITDGVLDDRQAYEEDNKYVVGAEATRLLEEASKQAGTHDWPIYSVQLNYGNGDHHESELARERLALISSNGGENKVGSVECKNDDDVFIALDSIFKDFKKLDIEDPTPKKLPGAYYFDVDELASEASIDIFGEGIASVSLYRVDQNNERIKDYKTDISSDVDEKRLRVSAGDGYYAIKLICPDEGNWEVYIDGTGEAQVLISENILKEMRLAMDAKPVTQEDPLTKNNTIEVYSYFTYHGINKDDSDVYGDIPAVLKVYDENDNVIDTISEEDGEYYRPDRNGYHFTLPLKNFPDEESIQLQVVVEDGRFKDGIKRSSVENFAFKDLPTVLVEPVVPTDLTKHVGGKFELDLRNIFVNPDGDPLEYTLTCENDPTVVFEYTEDADQMTIPAGMKPGEYQVTIGVKGEEVKYTQLTLTVRNDVPWVQEDLPDMELWSDCYWFQDMDSIVNTLNLNDYFRDAEKMPLSYTVKSSEEGIVKIDNDQGALTLNTIEGMEGEVVLTVTAADGITPDSIATDEMIVSVVSGKMVFWRQNWIYFALAAAVIVITVLVIVILQKNKRIRGNWEITIDDNGTVDIIDKIDLVYTAHGKKGKCLLKDLLGDLVPYTSDPQAMSLNLPGYFGGTGAEKIELLGVNRKRGCDIRKIPKTDKVKVAINGIPTKNKASVNGGILTFIIEQGDGMGETLTISMRLL